MQQGFGTGFHQNIRERILKDDQHSKRAGIPLTRSESYSEARVILGNLGLGTNTGGLLSAGDREYLAAVRCRSFAAWTLYGWVLRLRKLAEAKGRFPQASIHELIDVCLAEAQTASAATQRNYASALQSIFRNLVPGAVDTSVLAAHVAGLTALGADIPTNQARPVEAADWDNLERLLSYEELAFCAVSLLLGLRWEGTARIEDLVVQSLDGDVLRLQVKITTTKTEDRPNLRTILCRGRARAYLERFLRGRRSVGGVVFNVPYKSLYTKLKRAGLSSHAMKRAFAQAVDDMGVSDDQLQRLTGHRRYRNAEVYLGLERSAVRAERRAGTGDAQLEVQRTVM